MLAALVFYESLQAVPSLVRSWWEGCKNKQLSLAFASTISRYFSPVLVDNQLVHLRDPTDVLAKPLRDDPNFSVKVSSTTSEVKATYVVDEQTMEITVRLPPDFPLQSVEVKDVRKIGVTEATWRAWLLAVQQVLTTQGGKIVDALTLFKRNVSLHFEGVEACAICYSIISVTDRTLPNKSCRTCNNKFHASCLFKVRGCPCMTRLDADSLITVVLDFTLKLLSAVSLALLEIWSSHGKRGGIDTLK